MSDDMMNLRSLVEKSADADLLREMIGFTAEKLMALEVGALMKAPEGAAACWNFYFCVDNIDAAVKRIAEKGGSIAMGPHQVPGDAWIVEALDPQGASFALVGARA
ncbi:MAG: hypothetical protein H5U13_09070 [Parvibaculum sp.]|nr:hypothetical protein [Parvibaculum sp.]